MREPPTSSNEYSALSTEPMKTLAAMSLTLLVSSFLFVQGSHARQTPEVFEPAVLDSLYQSGIEFGIFLDHAERRKERWNSNFSSGTLSDALQSRAAQVSGTWYLLAVAVDGCSDSVSTIPYLAHLVAATDAISMRIIDPDAGRTLMEARRTPDDRAATPTVLVLDADFNEVGAFIERPAALQEWALGDGASLSSPDFSKEKFAWYDADAGQSTIAAVLDIIDQAAATGADGE